MSNRRNTRRKCAPQPTCEERVERALDERIHDLDALWKAYEMGIGNQPDLETPSDYGLAFDFVVPKAGCSSNRSYFRYPLSRGGPSDEFRFFAAIENGHWKPYCIEYWYLDWFDSAKRTLQGTRLDLMLKIFAWFDEGSLTHHVYRDSRED